MSVQQCPGQPIVLCDAFFALVIHTHVILPIKGGRNLNQRSHKQSSDDMFDCIAASVRSVTAYSPNQMIE